MKTQNAEDCGETGAGRFIQWFRWSLCAAGVLALWACNSPRLVAITAEPRAILKKRVAQSLNRKLDLLFLVDNSVSMKASQDKLSRRLPEFMQALRSASNGLPDLHVAVVSSSLGAGVFGNVPGCQPGHPGNDDGAFQHAAACSALKAGETFIKAGPGGNNFTGDIADVFACMALLGAGGCGFEHQFAAVELALQRATNPDDSVNGGFLRPDAYLGVVMLTNEDDCSVPADSMLFDPGQSLVSHPLGGLNSYRCNEFGHLCDGVPPPHNVSGPVTLKNCVPAEESGRLIPVKEFVRFLKGLKPNEPGKVLVAALAGATTPYVVDLEKFPAVTELQPNVRHSCMGSNDDFATPAVRVNALVAAFGENGVMADICQSDFTGPMERIAAVINRNLAIDCITETIANRPGTDTPDCRVEEVVDNVRPGRELPACDATASQVPCWRLVSDAQCADGKVLRVCRDSTCSGDPATLPAGSVVAEVACAISP